MICLLQQIAYSLATRRGIAQNHNIIFIIILRESNYFMNKALYQLPNCGFALSVSLIAGLLITGLD